MAAKDSSFAATHMARGQTGEVAPWDYRPPSDRSTKLMIFSAIDSSVISLITRLNTAFAHHCSLVCAIHGLPAVSAVAIMDKDVNTGVRCFLPVLTVLAAGVGQPARFPPLTRRHLFLGAAAGERPAFLETAGLADRAHATELHGAGKSAATGSRLGPGDAPLNTLPIHAMPAAAGFRQCLPDAQ